MRRTLWAVGLLAVTLPARADAPAPRYKVGDTFTQEVVVTRRSAFRVLGVDAVKGSRYSLASTLAVNKVNADGSLEATQTIKAARLLDADVDVREALAAALAKTQGVTFDLTVAADGDVTGLRGLKDPPQVRVGKDADVGASLRVWSVMDADGWKEIGSRTFFLPERPLREPQSLLDPAVPRGPWTRDAAHDWGPLGSWKGKTAYAARGPDKAGAERIEYAHRLTFKPPAAGKDRELPLKVLKSDFRIVTAGGVILYQPSVRRVSAAEEAFRVRGAVLVSLGGVEAAVELEEQQGFRVTVADPAARRGPAK